MQSARRALLFCLGFGGAASTAAAQSLLDPALGVTTYVSGFSQPTSFVFLPDPTGQHVDLLVCEKATGKVRFVRDQVLAADAALDLNVNRVSERGLLGIAVHPDFALNHFVYLYATISSTTADTDIQSQVSDNRVLRATWNPTSLLLESPSLILSLPATPGPNHDGGVILFGPDRKLYGVIGDLNRNGQLENFPQGPAPDNTAIIFRVEDDGTPVTDNPYYSLGGNMQKVYAYGVRNSFGLGFDPVSGVLWDTENGPGSYDEVNRVAPGFNSGWEPIMGPDARNMPSRIGDLWNAGGTSTYSEPEFSWLATIAPTAIHFPPTDALGEHYQNDCIIGDNNNGNLYHFEMNAGRTAFVMPDPSVQDLVADSSSERNLFLWGQGFGVVTDIDTGPDSCLYVVSLSLSRISRIARLPTSGLGPIGFDVSLVAFPNPFQDATLLRLEGDRIAAVNTLRIYSTAGRLVRVLAAGGGRVEWDGHDGAGRRVPAGVYYVRLDAGEHSVSAKLVCLRRGER